MPIIKSKRGELTAIRLLSNDAKKRITPFLDVIPPNPFGEKPKPLIAHLNSIVERVAETWTDLGPIFVDTFDVGPKFVPGGKTAIQYLCDALLALHIQAIPVTGIQREAAHDAAVATLLDSNPTGLCLRLEEEDLVLPKKLGSLLNDRLEVFNLTPDSVDLVLDLRLIGEELLHNRVTMIRKALQAIPDLTDWRRLILAGSAMPNSLEGVCERGESAFLERREWSTWVALHDEELVRIPDFGDYTTIPPQFVEMDPRTIAKHLGPNVKYTLDGQWFVSRGKSFQKFGSNQYFEIAKSVVQLPKFRGAKASYGDRFIADRASGLILKSGNPEQWVTASVNSHVTWQLSCLS
jgi:hypothetical protein